MARTAITKQTVSLSSITPSYAAANVDGNSFANNGRELLQVKNAAGSQITVTVQTPSKMDGVDVEELTFTVAATTGDKMCGPFPTRVFNQTDGSVYVDYSAVTSVTVAVFVLP